MLANAIMTDTQNGKKSTDNNNIIEAKIRNTIFLYYLEANLKASPV